MKTIANTIFREDYEIKKSKFKVTISRVDSKAAVEKFLKENSDPKASHNCFAYVINGDVNIEQFHNDGEPSGTAGEPLINLIKKNNLSNIVILVTRFFGGIKLGAGPLMRAYNSSANDLLKKCQFINLVAGFEVGINFKLEQIKLVDSILVKYGVISKKQFTENVNYIFETINEGLIMELKPLVEINYIINKFVSQV
ncbi:IMPACT family protein [Spiroplasma alleghenense]|uniref:Impact N-terminal domain-containing protein n=1 Tax=Spiroplasma alleghenense TaxID=216931 RepID=A0A345Z2B1_9MOLU|nr:YigZ family protein [Spiroplasma alleghenense]AXK50740.1 hypothetical protein SALLE_v1c00640 [Spiroplasma alleghenense]